MNSASVQCWSCAALVFLTSVAAASGKAAAEDSASGIASWYGGNHAGRRTASGEIHSLQLRTAAHRSLPFGSILRITNLKNGRVCLVRVNDRGPFIPGRLIDLSERAARDLAMLEDGLAPIRLQVLYRK